MTTAEKIEVMQAHEDGKVIQYSELKKDNWMIGTTLQWHWGAFKYRIKPKVQETLEDNIKAKWPQYEVVMLDFGGTGMLEIQSGIKRYSAHIVAQSMKGFQGYVYLEDNGDIDDDLCSRPADMYFDNDLNSNIITPVAAVFEKGELCKQ